MPDLPVVRAAMRVDADGFVSWVRSPGPSEPLPLEFALRELLHLDLWDREAVSAFVSSNGVISLRHPYVDLGDVRRPDSRRAPNHISDVTMYLAIARALSRHWLAFAADEPLQPVWEQEVAGLGVYDEESAWAQWVQELNRGLNNVAVRAELPLEEYEDVVIGEPRGGLYSACCIQIYNLAVDAIPPRLCADESCSNLFVRQRGGAKAGQYRTTGQRPTYCSPRCARRQTQRNRRAGQRKRAETMRLMRP